VNLTRRAPSAVAIFVAASTFGCVLFSGGPAGHSSALADTPVMTDAERSKACAKLADEIKKTMKDYTDLSTELHAIAKANPKLAGPPAFIKPLDDLFAKLSALLKDQTDLCTVHFTMPPPSQPSPAILPGGQTSVTNTGPGPAKTDSPTQKALREISKACNNLRSDYARVVQDLRQLQSGPGAQTLGQAPAWPRLQNDVASLPHLFSMPCVLRDPSVLPNQPH